jgi:heme oxygenase
MTFVSEGSNLGAARWISQAGRAADQKDDTHAWLVREVVNLF